MSSAKAVDRDARTHINKDDVFLEANSLRALLGDASQLVWGEGLGLGVNRDDRTLAVLLVVSPL